MGIKNGLKFYLFIIRYRKKTEEVVERRTLIVFTFTELVRGGHTKKMGNKKMDWNFDSSLLDIDIDIDIDI